MHTPSDKTVLKSLSAKECDQTRFGAALARPSINSMLMRSMNFMILGPARPLVQISFGFESPDVFSNHNTLSTLICWMYKNDVSMCRSFPSPCLWIRPRAADASLLMTPPTKMPKSKRADFTPNVSDTHFTSPYNSLSAEESATIACVFDQLLM